MKVRRQLASLLVLVSVAHAPSSALRRALVEESCDEESHQMLMTCYMAQGLRHLAVRQFQICANALKSELGLSPSEGLDAFYRRVVAAG